LITFRNSNSAMQLNGTHHFKVTDVEGATKFVEAAKAAAASVELDQAFRETMRSPRKAKDYVPA
jgi:3-deoxy-D-manno-octulosonic acid (KDO) 8-phosphate synthase